MTANSVQLLYGAQSLPKNIKLSVAPNGTLRVSMPLYAPVFLAKRFIASSRHDIRNMILPAKQPVIEQGMQIGKSHHLETRAGSKIEATIHGRVIYLTVPERGDLNDPTTTQVLQPVVITAFRKEAKSYLPKRLSYLANIHGFSYERVRFSHASTRWGSCSSNGTISLNIALMRLDFELIDYVLLHELCHTKEMNHGQAFWQLVEKCDPDFKAHRKLLKAETPFVL